MVRERLHVGNNRLLLVGSQLQPDTVGAKRTREPGERTAQLRIRQLRELQQTLNLARARGDHQPSQETAQLALQVRHETESLISHLDRLGMEHEMIEVLRGYESYQKMMRSIDDMNAKLINDVGRLA